jgi:hypothetical protein
MVSKMFSDVGSIKLIYFKLGLVGHYAFHQKIIWEPHKLPT